MAFDNTNRELKFTIIIISIIIFCSSTYLSFSQEYFYSVLSKFTNETNTNSQSTGKAKFIITNENSIFYSINASNIENVTSGHIHQDKQDENDPIIVPIFNYDYSMNKVFERGIITDNSLQGPLANETISKFIHVLRNGDAYVDIHTRQNPSGEIYGQIISGSKNH
jgi:hypothetical protein